MLSGNLYYSASGEVLGQMAGHNNIYEIYSHLFAAFFLFFACLVAIAVVYYTFRKSVYSWPVILAGLFHLGLIGLGEGLEHFFALDLYVRSMAHYLHLFSAPIAVLTLYLGMRETVSICKDGIHRANMHSIEIIIAISAAAWIGIFIMAILSHTPWNERIEGPFLLGIFLPTLLLVAMVLWESRHFAESTEMLHLPILAVAASFLTLDIWVGRFVDIKGHAALYILTHSFQDTLLAATGGIVILFSISTWYSHRIGRLFVMGVSSRDELYEKERGRNY